MLGLLKEKSEIEKLQREFKILTEKISNSKKPMPIASIPVTEMELEECGV